jgi:hypothetical protein
MHLHLTSSGPDLVEPDDCTTFDVVVAPELDTEALTALLAEHKIGTLAAGEKHVFVSPEALRALADGRTGEDWSSRFDKMLAYAATKGWIGENGDVRGHIDNG